MNSSAAVKNVVTISSVSSKILMLRTPNNLGTCLIRLIARHNRRLMFLQSFVAPYELDLLYDFYHESLDFFG
jgi:hypothetical protein